MRFSKAILLAVTALIIQMPSFAAEQRDAARVDKLQANMVDGDTISVRGSTVKGKALGLYGHGGDIVFRSGYEKLPSKTQAEWAYDLNEFVVSKGGGLDNYVKYIQENAAKGRKKALFEGYSSDSKPDPYDPDARAHVSYADQKAFAKDWWTARDEGYKTAVMKDWWLNDAILDGTNVEYQVEAKAGNSADAQAWRDSELVELIRKK